MTPLQHLRELVAWMEKSKRFRADNVATKHLREQLKREEGMIRRGRWGRTQMDLADFVADERRQLRELGLRP